VAMFPERVGCGWAAPPPAAGPASTTWGAIPQSRVAPSHGASARSARLEPARATSGAPLGGEPECALAKMPKLLLPTSALERVGVYPLNESGRVLIELLESDELTCSLMIYSFSGISSRRTARGVTSEDMLHEDARRLIKIVAAPGAPRLADVPLQTAREMDLPSAEVVPLSTGDEAGITVGEVS